MVNSRVIQELNKYFEKVSASKTTKWQDTLKSWKHLKPFYLM